MTALLRLFFALLYQPLAFAYDAISAFVSMGQWRSWQRAALPYRQGTRILEIAHGTGNLLLDLRAQGLQPLGLDASPTMGRIARRKLLRMNPRRALPLTQGRVQALPFASASLDTLLSTFPAEFIVDPAAIAEFARVLRPGGRLVCVPAAHITGRGLPDRFAHWLFRATGQASSDWYQPLIKRYAQGGFQARVEQQTLPRSVVLILIAEKPPVPPDGVQSTI